MKLLNIELKYKLGGNAAGLSFAGSIKVDGVQATVSDTPGRFSLTLDAAQEIELNRARAEFEYNFNGESRLFLNGYQSWTDSREHTVKSKLHGIDKVPGFINNMFGLSQYGDYNFVPYSKKKGCLHGFSYGYIRDGGEYFLIASLAEQTGFTIIRFDAANNKITLEKDCVKHHFKGEYKVFDTAFIKGGENEVFDEYFSLLNVPKPRGGRITGYTSWYNLYENITEATIADDLAGFAASGEKPDVFQIDDGYEAAVGDWLLCDKNKFPSGMKAAAQKIRDAGMLPGIWLAPFAAENDSTLLREHPEWLLKDENGAPAKGGGNWSGFYGLDIYNLEFREYLKQVFDTVINDWGYKLVKLDFLYAACILPRHDKTRAMVMYDGMKCLRELCGDAYIIGCGVPLAPAYGNVDYCRIGCDVSLSWDDKFYMRPLHRERPSTKNTILNTVFRRQLDGRAFRNDPDVFLLRSDNISLTESQKQTLATVNALFGGVLFTSDNIGKYDGKTKAFYDSLLTLSASDLVSADMTDKGALIVYKSGGSEKRLTVKL